jgi:hypothetical protein
VVCPVLCLAPDGERGNKDGQVRFCLLHTCSSGRKVLWAPVSCPLAKKHGVPQSLRKMGWKVREASMPAAWMSWGRWLWRGEARDR